MYMLHLEEPEVITKVNEIWATNSKLPFFWSTLEGC
jgi:hypothetical protein